MNLASRVSVSDVSLLRDKKRQKEKTVSWLGDPTRISPVLLAMIQTCNKEPQVINVITNGLTIPRRDQIYVYIDGSLRPQKE